MTKTETEPPGERCPGGGERFAFGADGNGNGVLDEWEVRGRSVVCDGAANLNGCTVQDEADGTQTVLCGDGTRATVRTGANGPLMRSMPVAPGPDCPNGGTRVEAGADRNADRVLEDDEVTSYAFVCYGLELTGMTLTRVEAEPPGDACAIGGSRILAGLDADGDGTLDDDEVQVVAVVCSAQPPIIRDGILEGDYVIDSSDDAALIAGVTRITGHLSITGPYLDSIDLPSLAFASGIFVDADNLTRLRLSGLEEVSGHRELPRDEGFGIVSPLEELDLSSLRWVELGLGIMGPGLETVDLPSLEVAGDVLNLAGADITSVRLPALTDIDDLYVLCPAEELDAPSLTRIAGELVVNDTNLVTLDLPALTEGPESLTVARNRLLTTVGRIVGGQIIYSLAIRDNPVLQDIQAMPALTTVDDTLNVSANASLRGFAAMSAVESVGVRLQVRENSLLEELDMSALRDVPGDFWVYDNPTLPACSVDSIVQQLGGAPGDVRTWGNDDAAVCD